MSRSGSPRFGLLSGGKALREGNPTLNNREQGSRMLCLSASKSSRNIFKRIEVYLAIRTLSSEGNY